jgi:hypothetical protein
LPGYDDCESGYRVRLGSLPNDPKPSGLLVAGIYAQTFTSLNTMEAANESARHAVNGLIAHHQLWRAGNKIRAAGTATRPAGSGRSRSSSPRTSSPASRSTSACSRSAIRTRIEIQGQDKVVDYLFKICDVSNQAYTPEQLETRFKEALWTLTAFGRYDPF